MSSPSPLQQLPEFYSKATNISVGCPGMGVVLSACLGYFKNSKLHSHLFIPVSTKKYAFNEVLNVIDQGGSCINTHGSQQVRE